MLKFKALLPCCLLALAVLNTACKKDDDGSDQQEYDRQAMISNMADNVILPAFADLKNKSENLNTTVIQFSTTPTISQLQTTRAAFKEAYLAYQHVSMLHMGPADQDLMRQMLNTFPTNTDSIQNRLVKGAYNLTNANPAAKGFPTLEYLLFSNADDNIVVNSFVTDTYAANRKAYLQAVALDIRNLSAKIQTAWSPAGADYAGSFKQAIGTSVGSATSELVNNLNNDIDMLKRFKVGIPSGIIGGQIRATNLEGFYSGYSKELLRENVLAQKNVFTGGTGQGLDDYLNFLEAKRDGQPLATAITTKYDEILAQIDALPNPLSQSVTSHNQQYIDLYNNLNQLIILTKTDMPSALGVSITYQDNDGD